MYSQKCWCVSSFGLVHATVLYPTLPQLQLPVEAYASIHTALNMVYALHMVYACECSVTALHTTASSTAPSYRLPLEVYISTVKVFLRGFLEGS
jgi:hypothetical protein